MLIVQFLDNITVLYELTLNLTALKQNVPEIYAVAA